MSQPSQPTYTGSFPRPLDDRNRITVPIEWRFAADSNDMLLAVPMTGPKGNYVVMLPPARAARARAKFDEIPEFDEKGQEAKEDFYSTSQEVWFDKAGRIMLNDALMDHAGIKRDGAGSVVLAGSGNAFAIYAAEVMASAKKKPASNHGETMRRYGI